MKPGAPQQKPPVKKIVLWTLAGIAAAVLLYFFAGWPAEREDITFGITWSRPYAEELGLNSTEGLEIMLEDGAIRHFRIPAYWNLIEAEPGEFDFAWLDEELDLIDRYGGKVTLAVGARLPRWPECWEPEWAAQLDEERRRASQLNYLKKVYERYSEHPAIERWQIENEVSFTFFADCHGLDRELVREELDLIRGFERSRPNGMRRPVITTDSGELSTWMSFAGHVDGKGVSIYRRVTNPWLGLINYWFVPPWSYSRKARLVEPFIGHIHVSEFQMEPWADLPLPKLENAELDRTLDIEQMKRNLKYAKRTGLDEVYFWGAEWWLYMREARDNPAYFDTMSEFFMEQR